MTVNIRSDDVVGLWLAIAFMVLLLGCSARVESFEGTNLSARNQAAPFALISHTGERVSLDDLKGKVVVLTFLYTNCPDVCPITTSHLRDAYEMLGSDASRVAFATISVDPQRDTIESARDYSDKWGMTDRWSYLVGTREELLPIWKAFYIDPIQIDRSEGKGPPAETPITPSSGVSGLRESILERHYIIHSSPVYLIDQEGAMRVVFTLPFEPQALVHDIRVLLK